MERHLYLRLKPSKTFRVYLFVLLLLCWGAIAQAALHELIRLLMAVAVTALVWRHQKSNWSALVSAIVFEQGEWQIETVAGLQAVRLCAESVVTYSITVLCFQLANGSRLSVVLLPDSADAERLRQLRVLLLSRPFPTSTS